MNKKQFRKEIESKLDTAFGYLAIGGQRSQVIIRQLNSNW